MLLGVYPHRENGVETDEYSNMYDRSKYLFMLEAKFDIGSQCCSLMKKRTSSRIFQKNWQKAYNCTDGFRKQIAYTEMVTEWL